MWDPGQTLISDNFPVISIVKSTFKECNDTVRFFFETIPVPVPVRITTLHLYRYIYGHSWSFQGNITSTEGVLYT